MAEYQEKTPYITYQAPPYVPRPVRGIACKNTLRTEHEISINKIGEVQLSTKPPEYESLP